MMGGGGGLIVPPLFFFVTTIEKVIKLCTVLNFFFFFFCLLRYTHIIGIFHEFFAQNYLSISRFTWKMSISSKLALKKKKNSTQCIILFIFLLFWPIKFCEISIKSCGFLSIVKIKCFLYIYYTIKKMLINH